MVAAMDENVGRIIETLEKNGLDKNTWIIFTSDNGGRSTLFQKNAETSNIPLRAGKGWCYEGGIRVPLIIAGPDKGHYTSRTKCCTRIIKVAFTGVQTVDTEAKTAKSI